MAAWLERRFGAEITWLPFDLHPEYPPGGITRAQLDARYGRDTTAFLHDLFARYELPFTPHERIPNSRSALRLTELARELGRHEAFHDGAMDAFWAQACDLGDEEVLLQLADDVGLPRSDAERVLRSEEFLPRVLASTAQAQSLGINGIPAFLLDSKLLVLGAQPNALFERAFEQLEAA